MVLVKARILTPKNWIISIALACHRSRLGSTAGVVASGRSLLIGGWIVGNGGDTIGLGAGCGVFTGVGVGNCWGGGVGWAGVVGMGTLTIGAIVGAGVGAIGVATG